MRAVLCAVLPWGWHHGHKQRLKPIVVALVVVVVAVPALTSTFWSLHTVTTTITISSSSSTGISVVARVPPITTAAGGAGGGGAAIAAGAGGGVCVVGKVHLEWWVCLALWHGQGEAQPICGMAATAIKWHGIKAQVPNVAIAITITSQRVHAATIVNMVCAIVAVLAKR